MKYSMLDGETRRILLDIQQLYRQCLESNEHINRYRGGMTWKTVNNKDYLYRIKGRRGYGKSLGVRSEKTETIYQQFKKEKEEASVRNKELKAAIVRQSRFCKAASIDRVPRSAAKVARVLEAEPGLDQHIIIDTHALYAYEMLAGVQIDRNRLATTDIDLLWGSGNTIKLVIDADIDEVLSALKKADKTFERLNKKRYVASNSNGFLIELIKPKGAATSGLDCLLSQKPLEIIVIAEDGQPVNWRVPDPRLFAAHKLWLSNRDDRESVKKSYDYAQAELILQLCSDYLPEYQIDEAFMKNIPSRLLMQLNEYLNNETPDKE